MKLFVVEIPSCPEVFQWFEILVLEENISYYTWQDRRQQSLPVFSLYHQNLVVDLQEKLLT